MQNAKQRSKQDEFPAFPAFIVLHFFFDRFA